ncbi:MAG: cytidylate kinase-like family protein [Lentisphaeria bacterium]|nr:cytidylate kinase-like family protein [Lentisphaeria bacterium]
MKKVITLSRQFCSGGSTIGRKLSQTLSIPCYDSSLLDKIAEKSGFDSEYIREEGEYSKGILSMILSHGTGELSNQEKLWVIQHNIISKLGTTEDCIIVGRCADYILKEKADCLNIFIHADMDFRKERLLASNADIEPDKCVRFLKKKDKARAAHYNYFTDQGWGDAKNYHLTLDAGKFGIEKCVEIISSLYKKG